MPNRASWFVDPRRRRRLGLGLLVVVVGLLAVIAERATKIKALRKPVLIRWFWEMDGNNKAEWAESPEAYVAAWKTIRNVFDDQGADNVSWVWCPNASGFADGSAQRFYPGDRFVDWVCADGYNWAPGRMGDSWRSFAEVFRAFYDWGSRQGKPLMIGEFGVQEREAGEKAAWLRAAKDTLKTEFTVSGEHRTAASRCELTASPSR